MCVFVFILSWDFKYIPEVLEPPQGLEIGENTRKKISIW